jgi:alpha-glucoside transport system substrate-binding protein
MAENLRARRSRAVTLSASACSLLLFVAGCLAAAPQPNPETVRVLASWEGEEHEAFLEVIEPFTERTGITVEYTFTRDVQRVLRRLLDSSRPPDLVGLVGPGHMVSLARAGELQDLSGAIDVGAYKAEVAPTFVELGTVDGRLVGAFVRSTLKGLIWFDPNHHPHPMPTTWLELELMTRQMNAATPWCVGLASDQASGWPGTDWIESFVLHQNGPDVYDEWVAGRLAWTSKPMREAWKAFGRVVAEDEVFGGKAAALETPFFTAGAPLFDDPPGCLFLHQGSFMPAFFFADGMVAGEDFDFFPFPGFNDAPISAVTGGGDLFGLLTDSPAAKELIRYLVTPEAQRIWVAGGGGLSANSRVTEYPDEISSRAAELLASATHFRFDASDLMPGELNLAFWSGVLAFTADQSSLDRILEELETIRLRAYGP